MHSQRRSPSIFDDHSDDDDDDSSVFYTPIYTPTPNNLTLSPQLPQAVESSSLPNALENAAPAREFDGSRLGMLSIDRSPPLHYLRATEYHSYGCFRERELSGSDVDSVICNRCSDQAPSSPDRSPSSASEKSLHLKDLMPTIAARRHLSMKLRHDGSQQNTVRSSAQYKRKPTKRRTPKISSETPFSERDGSNGSVELGTGTVGENAETQEREMDLSVFTLCRAVNGSGTVARRSFHDIDKHLLKGVESSSCGLSPSDTDQDISKQFLWLFDKNIGAPSGRKQPLPRRSRTSRMPFRSFVGKLVPCISTSVHHEVVPCISPSIPRH